MDDIDVTRALLDQNWHRFGFDGPFVPPSRLGCSTLHLGFTFPLGFTSGFRV